MKSWRDCTQFFLPTFFLLPTEHAAGRLASPCSPRRLQPRGQVCYPGARPDSTSRDRVGAGSPTLSQLAASPALVRVFRV